MKLAGKHALVTGGARGIGFAIARALIAEGAAVTLAGRHPASLQVAAEKIGAAYAVMDVCDPASVALACANILPVDMLINNAGQAHSAPFLKTDAALWREMMAVNLDGVFYCSQAFLPAMLNQGWGRIVNVASSAGLRGYAYVAAYCAAKHGVVGLTRALAQEVANKGVTVNAVCPGYTETEIITQSIANIVAKTGKTEDQARAKLAADNPQQRLIQPEEVANVVAWLCAPESQAIHGQAIAVAGGEHL